MADRAQTDFGRLLREARERRGVSLRELANTTKISMSVLEGLERNDISHLPGGIFGRGFVRSYAVGVGLDPELAIQVFIAQFPHESVTAGHPASAEKDDNDAIESDRRTATTFVRLIALSIPLVGVVLYFSTAGRRIQPAATPSPAEASTVARENGATASRPISDIVLNAETRLAVVLVALRPCTISAVVDGDRVIDGPLAAGDERTFTVRRELLLTTNDGAAIGMTLNGAEAKPLGPQGRPSTARVDLTNFRDFLVLR